MQSVTIMIKLIKCVCLFSVLLSLCWSSSLGAVQSPQLYRVFAFRMKHSFTSSQKILRLGMAGIKCLNNFVFCCVAVNDWEMNAPRIELLH